MNKTEKEFVELTAQVAVNKAVEKIVEKLNCKEHDERIRNVEIKSNEIDNNTKRSRRNARLFFVFLIIIAFGEVASRFIR